MSVRRFKIETRIDGAPKVTVEITPTAGETDAIFVVRPLHSRRKYSLLMSEVVQMAVSRAAKQTASAQGTPVPTPRTLSRAEKAAEKRRNTLYKEEQ